MESTHNSYQFPFMLDFDQIEKETKQSIEDPVAGVDFHWIRPNSFRYGWKDTDVLRKKYFDWIKDYCTTTKKPLPGHLEIKTINQLQGVYKGILCSHLKQKWYYQNLLKHIKYETGIKPKLDIHAATLEKLVEAYEHFKREWE